MNKAIEWNAMHNWVFGDFDGPQKRSLRFQDSVLITSREVVGEPEWVGSFTLIHSTDLDMVKEAEVKAIIAKNSEIIEKLTQANSRLEYFLEKELRQIDALLEEAKETK